MTASALAKVFGGRLSIRLIESEEIGTVGVGEATVPHLSFFNKLLEIDEVDFIKQTQGTFKLGIQFKDWARIGDSYIHGFGTEIGHDLGLPFHQYWIRAFKAGKAKDIGAYTLNTLAAPLGKFMASPIDAPANTPLAKIAYAYHFDAGRYARFLRGYAEARRVRRTEGKIKETRLHAGYDYWSHWLPCDRALAVPCENVGPPTPYTRSTARRAGWQWRIPLQHRTGNGHVYSSKYISDDEAAALLLANLDGRALGDPRPLRFTAGRRRKSWIKNVIAIGLSSGFLEPLESTSSYLIQSGIMRLCSLFPGSEISPILVDRYNTQAAFEIERIRDFIILHYFATERDDSPFWNYCRTMDIPETLRNTIALFRDSGRFYRNADEMFGLVSWVEVMLGQRIMPNGYHPTVDDMSDSDLSAFIGHVESVIAGSVAAMPPHQAFIDRFC